MHNRLFYCDLSQPQRVSYSELLGEVLTLPAIPRWIQSGNFYELFTLLVAAIDRDASLILVNEALPQETISNFVGDLGDGPASNATSQSLNTSTTAHTEIAEERQSRLLVELSTANQSDSPWSNAVQSWLHNSKARIGILTSGSGGRPKLVEHTPASLARGVRTGPNYANHVWGLAYHPTHFAGLQVFFQAFCNQNAMIRLFGLDAPTMHASIEQEAITHISATPTFFKQLCVPEAIFPQVTQITIGGELAPSNLASILQQAFPSASRLNVYASTEAGSLLASEGDLFRVPSRLTDKIKVIDGQLAIHRSLLAPSVQERCDDEFYLTGDEVEIMDSQGTDDERLAFRITSRRSDMINVGGYKVNPVDVEAALLRIGGIEDARVYGRENSVTGNIVCCDIVQSAGASLNSKMIRQALSGSLLDYQLPRIIQFVPQLPTTATGKRDRRV